jgi:transcriptional regulator with XRE-family HTH domain
MAVMTPLAPQVRSEFAKRLKIIRTQRGFPRARYFASTLGIEENRYTRYERAEVEPSLTLIHKMCETLGITPNELLGFEPVRARDGLAGFAETAQARDPGDPREAIAWQLAEEIVRCRREHEQGRRPADPLTDMRDTGALYRSLVGEPFETVSKIAEDPALMASGTKRKSEIANLMSRFTATLQAQRR